MGICTDIIVGALAVYGGITIGKELAKSDKSPLEQAQTAWLRWKTGGSLIESASEVKRKKLIEQLFHTKSPGDVQALLKANLPEGAEIPPPVQPLGMYRIEAAKALGLI
jgi:hypothetical protein